MLAVNPDPIEPHHAVQFHQSRRVEVDAGAEGYLALSNLCLGIVSSNHIVLSPDRFRAVAPVAQG